MKTELANVIRVTIELTRKQSEKFIEVFKNESNLVGAIGNIEYQLSPIYTYKIKCSGCGNKVNYVCYGEMTPQDIKKKEEYFLCDSCYDSEDFK